MPNTYFTSYINDKMVEVVVYYEPYRPATFDSPAEGCEEIEEVWALDDNGKRIFNIGPYLDEELTSTLLEELYKEGKCKPRPTKFRMHDDYEY